MHGSDIMIPFIVNKCIGSKRKKFKNVDRQGCSCGSERSIDFDQPCAVMVVKLKTKLDTLTYEKERLQKELHKVSPRRSDKCELCAHLRELNKTLQENFNSRLKDKNAIIKHLERRLRATGAGDDGSCTSYTEDVLATSEANTTGMDNPSSLSFQNPDDVLESEADGPSTDTPSDMGDDSCLASSRLQSKRLRLLKDGRKRNRYVEETPNAKRQKMSPTHRSQSYTSHPAMETASTETDNSVAMTTNSPVKESLKESAEKKLNETVLAGETELTFPADKQADSSVIQTMNTQNKQIQDLTTGDGRENIRSRNLIIPETLGLDVTSSDNESDNDDDAVSSILHLSSQPEGSLDTERKDLIDEDGDVTVCIGAKNIPSEIKTPDPSKSRTEITPSSLSPGIFDDIRKTKSNSDTPKSARSICHDEIHVNGASCENEKALMNTSAKNVLISLPSSSSNQKLRQATLSQSFKNHSPGTRGRRGVSSKTLGEYDDAMALHKAIKVSLQESLANKSKTVGTPGFKVPFSPEQLKACRSPQQHNLNEKENDVTLGPKTSPRSAKTGQESRRSPRLAKLVKTFSDPVMAEEMESARKNLFRETCSPRKQSSDEPHKEMPVKHTSHKEKHMSAEVKHQSNNGSNKSENSLKECVNRSDSQRTLKDSKLNSVTESTEDQTQNSGYKQRQKSNLPYGLNGSLNPDVQLSMYLESQKTSAGESELNPMTELDETVAPNLLSESRILMTSKEAMRELECLSTEEVTQDKEVEVDKTLMEDASDSEDTIAPSPEPNSLVVSQHSHTHSMPCASIPSSSRSFKFMSKSKSRGKSLTDADGRDLRKLHGKTLLGSQSCDGMKVSLKCEERGENKLNRLVSPDKVTADAGGRAKTTFAGDVRPKEIETFNDSFDVLPRKAEEFPHVKVVRKKSEKDKLQGFSCKECYEYYKDLNLSETELKYRMQVCSRHKAKYQPPATPEHFWSLSIRDMTEIDDPDEGNVEPVGVYKGPRRRRRLEKRFKSKNEEI